MILRDWEYQIYAWNTNSIEGYSIWQKGVNLEIRRIRGKFPIYKNQAKAFLPIQHVPVWTMLKEHFKNTTEIL